MYMEFERLWCVIPSSLGCVSVDRARKGTENDVPLCLQMLPCLVTLFDNRPSVYTVQCSHLTTMILFYPHDIHDIPYHQTSISPMIQSERSDPSKLKSVLVKFCAFYICLETLTRPSGTTQT